MRSAFGKSQAVVAVACSWEEAYDSSETRASKNETVETSSSTFMICVVNRETSHVSWVNILSVTTLSVA